MFCDHTHLHSFYYDTITSAADDAATDLNVWAWTMTGFTGICNYYDWAAMNIHIKSGKNMKVQGDQPSIHCGYYVDYEWSGKGDVFFEIHSMNAFTKATSSFILIALSTLLL